MAPSTPSALIVRFDPTVSDAAMRETRRLLTRIGEPDAIVRPCGVAGSLKVITEGDPHDAQAAVAGLSASNPECFRYTSQWTVADEFVSTDLEAIRHAVAHYQRSLTASDSWRVAVRHRDSGLKSQQVIDAVAPLLSEAPVDLEDPSKEIRIDMLGDETAVGIMDRAERFK